MKKTKTNDLINTMWEELTSYQPIAEKHGYGDIWGAMCKERTGDATRNAYDSVRDAKHNGVGDTETAVISVLTTAVARAKGKTEVEASAAHRAIECIRRAKEANTT